MADDSSFKLEIKDPLGDDSINRLVKTHNRNKLKQIQAQNANQQYLSNFQHRKSEYYENKIKDGETREERIQEAKDKIIQMIKKRNEQAHKILQKNRKFQEQRLHERELMLKKLKKTKQEFNNTPFLKLSSNKKSIESNHSDFYLETKREMTKTMASSLNASFDLLQKSQEKQKRAQKNRKERILMQSTFHIKRSRSRQLVRQRAEEEEKENYLKFMEKSIKKIMKFEERKQHSHQINEKKLKEKQRQDMKKMENKKKKLQSISMSLHRKYNTLEEQYNNDKATRKLKKLEQLEQNVMKKKQRREELQRKNMNLYQQKKYEFKKRAADIYKRDKQKWEFMTTLNSLKENLIEKNIYELNKISLKK